MTRLQQARFLAQTDPYWAAYCHGLDDKHRVCDPEPPPRRESWDSDWAPTPNETGAPQDGRTGGNGTGRPPADYEPATGIPVTSSDELLTNMARVIASTGHPAPKETT